jgi:hypothetical protein
MHRLVMKWNVLLVTSIVLFGVLGLQALIASDMFLSRKVVYEGSCVVESWEKGVGPLRAVLRCGELEAKTSDSEVLAEFLNSDASVLECRVSSNRMASCTIS